MKIENQTTSTFHSFVKDADSMNKMDSMVDTSIKMDHPIVEDVRDRNKLEGAFLFSNAYNVQSSRNSGVFRVFLKMVILNLISIFVC